jgi:ATP-dependent Zn protease
VKVKLEIPYRLLQVHRKLKAKNVPLAIRERVAVHEAGHAFAFMYLLGTREITAYIDGDAGWTHAHSFNHGEITTQTFWNYLCSVTAGMAAEQALLGKFGLSSGSADRRMIVSHYERYAPYVKDIFVNRARHYRHTAADQMWSDEVLTEENRTIFSAIAVETRMLLLVHRNKIEAGAAMLLERYHLDEKDLCPCFGFEFQSPE